MNKSNEIIIASLEYGYRICTETGSIYNKRGNLIKGCIASNGYRTVSIYIPELTNKKGYQVNVHRLVAYAKYGHCLFASGIEVRHLDGNKLNNRAENLALGTRLQNIMDMTPEQRSAKIKGKPSPRRKLSVEAVTEIITAYEDGLKYGQCKALAVKYDVRPTTISEIGKRKTYRVR